MPLTDNPVVLEGGCNCKAIRYRISVPAKQDRPLYIGGGGNVSPPVQAPLVCTDHCNDCRSATGSILPHWFLAPIDMVTISFIRRDNATVPEDGRLNESHPRGQWDRATDIFMADSADSDTYLTFFKSSKGRRRAFCARCGTMFAYQIFPTPENWPGVEFLDIVLGTLDRCHLEGDDLTPERQLWWDCGIPWVQRQSLQGLDVPVHPSAWVDKGVRDL